MNNNIFLITHDDLDGFGCKLLINRIFSNRFYGFKKCNYKNVNEEVLESINTYLENEMVSTIFITDISVNEETAELIDGVNKNISYLNIYLIDHHKTAEYLNKYDWALVSQELNGELCSATKLLFNLFSDIENSKLNKLKNILNNNVKEYLKNNTLVDFVEKVSRYDTWLWKNKYNDNEAKMLNDLFKMYEYNKFEKTIVSKIRNKKKLINNEELKLLEIKQDEINIYCSNKNRNIIKKKLLGYNAGFVIADSNISELGNKLAEWNPDLDFIAIICNNSISFRTIKDDIDVSKIAANFGGGGHPKASGCVIDTSKIIDFVLANLTINNLDVDDYGIK